MYPAGYPAVQGQASNATQKTLEKPRIASQIDQLEKLLSECHQGASALENVADRILGPTPQDTSKATTQPPMDTIERRLGEVINVAQALVERLHNASQRLNQAV
jgi:translation initiation factor 2B subunit (eIF-2B alpha/beta/delta family)